MAETVKIWKFRHNSHADSWQVCFTARGIYRGVAPSQAHVWRRQWMPTPGWLFFSPDVPPEAMQKRVFERIKTEAKRDGKVITDDTDVF